MTKTVKIIKNVIMANYKMYRFYKGGKINPFDNENDTLSARFWEAEYVFDSSYFKREK